MYAVIPLITSTFLVAGISPDMDPSAVENAQPKTQVTSIIHLGDWTESVEEARRISAEKKIPVILHFEASWCGACVRMHKHVLNDSAVREFLGKRVIGVKIDTDRHRDLIGRYRVSTLPTEIVIGPDGAEQSRYVGAVSLRSYLSRLQTISKQTESLKPVTAATRQNDRTDPETKKTRSCLIVRRDGKMVGLGGYSPVALSDSRKWQKGEEEFVVSFQGVDYFLQSDEEVTRFETKPEQFIPHLHGCDPVELHRSKQARTGAIEFGTFYKGELFFFASTENRNRFQRNPAWYLESDQQPDSVDEAAQLLDMIR